MITVTIPQGSNPCHGDIPEPAPKVKTPKPFSDADKVRAMQVKQRAEGSASKHDYERSHTPSTKMVKVKVIQYDMRHLCSACVDKYPKLSKYIEKMIQKKAPTPYLADDEEEYDETKEPQEKLQPSAAKVIINILYGARMARYDLLHSCQISACKTIQ